MKIVTISRIFFFIHLHDVLKCDDVFGKLKTHFHFFHGKKAEYKMNESVQLKIFFFTYHSETLAWFFNCKKEIKKYAFLTIEIRPSYAFSLLLLNIMTEANRWICRNLATHCMDVIRRPRNVMKEVESI